MPVRFTCDDGIDNFAWMQSERSEHEDSKAALPCHARTWLQAGMASVLGVLLCLIGYALASDELGPWLFIATPFVVGLAIAFMSRGLGVLPIILTSSTLLSLTILVFSGLEGLPCVVMAFPLLIIGLGIGALVGMAIGRRFISRYGQIGVIVLGMCSIAVAGFGSRSQPQSQLLVVETRTVFAAPLELVWQEVRSSQHISGDSSMLHLLHLPVPERCTLDADGLRQCHFDAGTMYQRITHERPLRQFDVEVLSCDFVVRDWLEFVDASYRFREIEEGVEVLRQTRVRSRLEPRWYWSWFERFCVQLEHDYVLGSMRRMAERRTGG